MFETLSQTPPVHHLADVKLPANDTLFRWAQQLTDAPAPSGGAGLPGTAGDVLADVLAALGVASRLQYNYRGTGNALLWLGAAKATPDLVLTAHLDRPTFRVGDVGSGALYPICADRFPQAAYQAGAVATRFADGRLTIRGRGTLHSDEAANGGAIRFEATEGDLQWGDSITLASPVQRDGDTIVGTGFDNALGVLTLALAASVFASVEPSLEALGRTLVFAFTEHEEGPPSGYFFSQGASRLAHSLPLPTIGVINVDGHSADDQQVTLGGGGCHGVVSSGGRGSVVPPHYAALAEALAGWTNTHHPGTVQMNYGYISRSDDMPLHRWSRMIGLVGFPLLNAHTGEETAHLDDLNAAARWLVTYMSATLGYVSAIRQHYALER